MKSGLAFLVFCLCVLFATQSQESNETWYHSDAAGMKHELAEGLANSGWSLLVITRDLQESATLHEDGLPVKKWLRTYDLKGRLEREALEQDGIMREEFLFDKNGSLSVERRYNENGTVEDTTYNYSAGRMVSKTVALDGAIVKVVSYLYAPDGRLASARESSGGLYASSAAMQGISYSWKLQGDQVELSGYDGSGRLVSVSVYAGTELVRREERTWKDGMLARIVQTEGSASITETAGKPLLILSSPGGKPGTTERRAYDDDGRIIEKELLVGTISLQTTYKYDQDGNLLLQSDSKNGLLIMVTTHESPSTRIEESWDKGALFARVRFEDGRKVLEEIIKDGVVVRSRSFE